MRKLWTVLFVLVLVSGASAQTILYQDSFTGGTSDLDWGDAWGGTSTFTVDVDPTDGGNYVGSLVSENFTPGTMATGEAEMTDYMIEAMVYVRVDAGATMYQGVVARIDTTLPSNEMTFYSLRLELPASAPKIKLRSFVGGTPSTILEWATGDITGGLPTENGWHKLGLQVKGNQLTAFFDDVQLSGTPVTSDLYSSGQFGIYSFFLDMTSSLDPIPSLFDDIVVYDATTTSVAESPESQLPSRISIVKAFPNPFNPETTISFQTPSLSQASVIVYDLMGRPVATLMTGPLSEGLHNITWNAASHPAGSYFIRLEADGSQDVRRVTLVK